jgi:hypothetical protein
MIPSKASTISGSTRTASGFSILAISGTPERPASFMIFRATMASSGLRTKDIATMSTPVASAQRRSSWSLAVSAGALTATPGRLMPLWSETRPPTTTRVRTRVPATPVTSTWTLPSSIRMRSPARTSSARPR